jgi:CheY-like chemotaxis protein
MADVVRSNGCGPGTGGCGVSAAPAFSDRQEPRFDAGSRERPRLGHLQSVPEPADGEPVAQVRVLIVDDDLSIRRLLRMLLTMDERLTVVGEAGDGRQALELLTDLDPDLVLLDLAMPVMNGLQVLRSLDGNGRPGVVVLTGFNDVQVREQSLEAGAMAFISKGDGFATLAEDLVRLSREVTPPADA